MRRTIEESVAVEGRGVTCSFGVAQGHAGDSTESLIGRADRALYRAKGAGRNRVSSEPAQPSSARTSSVCSPSAGAGAEMPMGDAVNRSGGPG